MRYLTKLLYGLIGAKLVAEIPNFVDFAVVEFITFVLEFLQLAYLFPHLLLHLVQFSRL